MSYAEPIPIDGRALFPREGIIEGGLSRPVDPPASLPVGFFLPDGQKMDATPGKAFLVNVGGTSWERIQFYRNGYLMGPIIYGEIEGEDVHSFMRKSSTSRQALARSVTFIAAGLAVMTVPALIHMVGYLDDLTVPTEAQSMMAFIELVGAGFALFGLPTVWRFLRAAREGGDYASELLHRLQGKKKLRIPLGPISRDSLA